MQALAALNVHIMFTYTVCLIYASYVIHVIYKMISAGSMNNVRTTEEKIYLYEFSFLSL